MTKVKDITGQRFGRLTAVKYAGGGEWFCKCDCGNYKLTTTSKLRAGDSRSCGCLYVPGHSTFKDLTGKQFGKLVALNVEGKNKGGNYLWRCRCVCGNEVIVSAGHLVSGHTASCGNAVHFKTYKHGMWDSRLHHILKGMKRRCYKKGDAAYRYYGARGIKVCDEWIDKEDGYKNFINWALSSGYSEGLSIDRIDNNGDYTPENCRWASRTEQMRNTRGNVYFMLNGEKRCLQEVCNITGFKRHNYYPRVRANQNIKVEDLFKEIDFSKHKIERIK